MVKKFLFGLLCVVGTASGQLHAQVDWRGVFVPESRKPVVYFPGVYAERSDTLTTVWGLTPIRRFYYNDPEGESGNRLYTLTIVDYPEGSLPQDSSARRQALFEETVAAATKSVDGELLFADALDQSEYVGYVFRIDYNEGSKSVYNRAYFVGDRYYHLQVFAIKGDGGTKSRERFFENFRPTAATDAAVK